MTAVELIQLVTSSGVLAGGVGICKWAWSIEKRLFRVEFMNERPKP